MPVLLISPDTGTAHQADVVIDTGAEVSIFDPSVAEALGLDLAGAARVNIRGIGGTIRASMPATIIEVRILSLAELSAKITPVFLDDDQAIGSLIGLDVLESIDFALSHRDRIVFFGRPR